MKQYRKTTKRSTRKNNKAKRSFTHTIAASFIAILVFSFVFGSFFSSAHSDEHTVSDVRCYKTIEIKYGETLWSIAEEYQDEHYRSTIDYIDELCEINQLENTDCNMIQEGTYLTVVYFK